MSRGEAWATRGGDGSLCASTAALGRPDLADDGAVLEEGGSVAPHEAPSVLSRRRRPCPSTLLVAAS